MTLLSAVTRRPIECGSAPHPCWTAKADETHRCERGLRPNGCGWHTRRHATYHSVARAPKVPRLSGEWARSHFDLAGAGGEASASGRGSPGHTGVRQSQLIDQRARPHLSRSSFNPPVQRGYEARPDRTTHPTAWAGQTGTNPV